MNAQLAKLLKNYLAVSGKSTDDFIFTNLRGKPISHDNFRKRQFLVDMEKSKVRVIRFHDLRHTAITQMVAHGFSLNVVQAIAGHKDIATTMKYVHLLGNSVEAVADSFSLGV